MFFKNAELIAVVAPGVDGAMGTITPDTDDIYASYLVSQSFQINMPSGQIIREWVDGADVASIAIPGRKDGTTIQFRLDRLDNTLLELFMGGSTAGTGPVKYSQPSARQAIYKSVAITAGAFGGEQFYWEIPYTLVTAGIVGNPTLDAEGKAELDVTCEVLTPTDAAGLPLDSWDSWDLLDVP